MTFEEKTSQKLKTNSTKDSAHKEYKKVKMNRLACGNLVFNRRNRFGFDGFSKILEKANNLNNYPISLQQQKIIRTDGPQKTAYQDQRLVYNDDASGRRKLPQANYITS